MHEYQKKPYHCMNFPLSEIIYPKMYGENKCFCNESAYKGKT